MTLVVSTVNNTFPYIPKHKTINQVSQCMLNVVIYIYFHLSLMLTNSIILTISGRDALRPLGIMFGPFAR